ncbi:hypothetical protein [Helicobacter sp. 11S02629-2]|uniref:hypothetical protein n=1 Tax=Helicobacter sp. 11S02629-2 TaxID=1476195 RepID=UPI000BA5B6EA|nr:hypothetical protein [Helicobacter sp. 11S02629-2]PAF44171.1 hypothetical protein BKH40_06130 [Helicobacter sp. 11S02629-2]
MENQLIESGIHAAGTFERLGIVGVLFIVLLYMFYLNKVQVTKLTTAVDDLKNYLKARIEVDEFYMKSMAERDAKLAEAEGRIIDQIKQNRIVIEKLVLREHDNLKQKNLIKEKLKESEERNGRL